MSYFTPAQVEAAVKAHRTVFFDMNLQPVVPEPGQWFCEFEQVTPEDDREPFIRDEALVEFVETTECRYTDGGTVTRHLVFPEYGDEVRPVRGVILIRQA